MDAISNYSSLAFSVKQLISKIILEILIRDAFDVFQARLGVLPPAGVVYMLHIYIYIYIFCSFLCIAVRYICTDAHLGCSATSPEYLLFCFSSFLFLCSVTRSHDGTKAFLTFEMIVRLFIVSSWRRPEQERVGAMGRWGGGGWEGRGQGNPRRSFSLAMIVLFSRTIVLLSRMTNFFANNIISVV